MNEVPLHAAQTCVGRGLVVDLVKEPEDEEGRTAHSARCTVQR